MFSFHKPKIYRSNLGCCICKAKSSSSRFTDSKKYENEFERCFRIQEKRSGEICNACVLLVKRWKKLSPENRLTKHWHHVVDARAGPGTKLTSTRRLTSPATNAHHHHHQQQQLQQDNGGSSASGSGQSSAGSGSHKQPLSSSQANNQGGSVGSSTSSAHTSSSSGAKGRTSGSFAKARAIDTNVSTFTFGETSRRSYMAVESGFTSTSSALTKPQSALNSSAFELVIKRFRQRQQQQQLEAQRRQLNRQQRQLHHHHHQQSTHQERVQRQARKQLPTQQSLPDHQQHGQVDIANTTDESSSQSNPIAAAETTIGQQTQPPNKRLKRSSESIGTLTVDGLRVSSLLDGSIWRKEKICCGIIFRGLHNEVAVFPKLLKPCQCRVIKLKQLQTTSEQQDPTVPAADTKDENDQDLLIAAERSPPPRATKSGSISSCDSNTSGTGSMEQPLELQRQQQHQQQQQGSPLQQQQHATPKQRVKLTGKQRRKSNLRPIELGVDDEAALVVLDSAQPATSATLVLGIKSSPKRPRSVPVTRRQLPGRKQLRATTTDTDSNASSSTTSSSLFSSSSSVASATALKRRRQQQQQQQQQQEQVQVHSPATSSGSSSGASSSRLLLMADDDELIIDEEDAGSNTDDAASSSLDSLGPEVEHKKSGGNAVGAMG